MQTTARPDVTITPTVALDALGLRHRRVVDALRVVQQRLGTERECGGDFELAHKLAHEVANLHQVLILLDMIQDRPMLAGI